MDLNRTTVCIVPDHLRVVDVLMPADDVLLLRQDSLKLHTDWLVPTSPEDEKLTDLLLYGQERVVPDLVAAWAESSEECVQPTKKARTAQLPAQKPKTAVMLDGARDPNADWACCCPQCHIQLLLDTDLCLRERNKTAELTTASALGSKRGFRFLAKPPKESKNSPYKYNVRTTGVAVGVVIIYWVAGTVLEVRSRSWEWD